MIYVYSCEDCGATKEEFKRVADRNDCPACDVCQKTMVKLIGGHSVISDLTPYYDDNLETHIQSRQHRKQVMREKGVYESYGKNWHTGGNTKRRRA